MRGARLREIGAALLAAALTACPSLDALSPGAEAGADVVGPTDARADATSDTGGDADADAGGEASSIDAADAASCTFVDADFSSAFPDLEAGCALGDGSTCAPGWYAQDQGYFDLAPPMPHTASCSATQIDDYLTLCPLGQPESTACQQWLADANNAVCSLCLAPADVSKAPKWGAIVIALFNSPFGQNFDIGFNVSGCIELVDPCNAPCARAMWAANQCEPAACEPSCNPSASTFQTCLGTANGCLCAGAGATYYACADALQAQGGPAASCFVPSFVLTTFCGNGQ